SASIQSEITDSDIAIRMSIAGMPPREVVRGIEGFFPTLTSESLTLAFRGAPLAFVQDKVEPLRLIASVPTLSGDLAEPRVFGCFGAWRETLAATDRLEVDGYLVNPQLAVAQTTLHRHAESLRGYIATHAAMCEGHDVDAEIYIAENVRRYV